MEQPRNAEHYHEKAERARHTAEHTADKKFREQLLDIAAEYDRLALNLEAVPRGVS